MKSIHLIILLLGLFSLNMAAQSDEVNIPFSDPSGAKELKMELFQGEIKIIGTDRQDILVSYENTMESDDDHYDNDEDSKGLKKIVGNNFELLMGSEDNTAIIQSQSWNKYLSFEIEVPKNINLDISKNIGENVIVDNIIGNVNIENNVGNVIATNISGIINASTNAGSLEIQLNSIPEPRTMMFNNNTGPIDLTLPKDYQADLKMKTQMGEIYSDLEIEISHIKDIPKTQNKDGRWEFVKNGWTLAKLNGGGSEITLKSHIGNIYLRGN